MESRVLVLLLGLTLGVGSLTGCARGRLVQAEDTTQPPVIEPDVERREIEVPRIDTEDFEVGILAGQISVEDFGVNTVAGARFAYLPTATPGACFERPSASPAALLGTVNPRRGLLGAATWTPAPACCWAPTVTGG